MEHIRLSLSQFFSTCYLSETWGSTATSDHHFSQQEAHSLGINIQLFSTRSWGPIRHIWLYMGLDVWAINLADTSRYKICIYIYTYKHQKSPSTGIFPVSKWLRRERVDRLRDLTSDLLRSVRRLNQWGPLPCSISMRWSTCRKVTCSEDPVFFGPGLAAGEITHLEKW